MISMNECDPPSQTNITRGKLAPNPLTPAPFTPSIPPVDSSFVALAAHAPFVLLVALDGQLSFVNGTACQLLGAQSPESLLGRALLSLFAPSEQARLATLLQNPPSGADVVRNWETALLRQDGTTLDVALTITNARWDGRPALHVMAVEITGRREAQAALHEREAATTELHRVRADFHLLFSRMIDGFAVHEMIFDGQGRPLDYRFLAVNPAFEKLTGLRSEAVIGRTVREVLPSEDPFWIETFGRVVSTGEPAFFQHASAQLHQVFEVSAFRNAPGQFACVFVDVTEHRRAAEALRRSEAELLAIYEQAPGMMILLDENLRACRVNRATVDFVGRAESELLGLPVGELIECAFECDQPRGCGGSESCTHCPLRQTLLETLQTGTPIHRREIQIHRLCHHQIENCSLLISTARVQVSDQPVVLLCLEDITQQKQAEGQVREQAALLEITQDAIIVLNLDGLVVFWNQAAERLYGWTKAEACGQPAHELVFAPSQTDFSQVRRELFSHGEWSGEFPQTTRDRRPLLVRCRASLVRNQDNRPKSILLVNTDITEQRTMEAKFLRSQRLESIGLLASGVAHDLNNVLSPVLMSLNILRLQLRQSEDNALLDMLEAGVKRGAAIIKQLLLFGRGLEGNRTRLKPGDALKDIAQIVRETFPKSIQLDLVVEKGLPGIVADPTQIHQVLLNLCVNARDAMPQGGTLTLSARQVLVDATLAHLFKDVQPGSHVLLEVQDTGEGIPRELLDRIFDPFFTTKKPGQGTGLGLATVQGIVRGHGGFVDVESNQERGTTFRVYLPTTETVHPNPDGEKPAAIKPRGQKELVLIIDDEQSIRGVISRVLQMNGYRVITAQDGLEGIQQIDRYAAELRAVVVDMLMPKVGGVGVIRHLCQKAEPPLLIAISGMIQMEQEAKLATNGPIAFLPKPFPMDQLLSVLDAGLHTNDNPASSPPESVVRPT